MSDSFQQLDTWMSDSLQHLDVWFPPTPGCQDGHTLYCSGGCSSPTPGCQHGLTLYCLGGCSAPTPGCQHGLTLYSSGGCSLASSRMTSRMLRICSVMVWPLAAGPPSGSAHSAWTHNSIVRVRWGLRLWCALWYRGPHLVLPIVPVCTTVL